MLANTIAAAIAAARHGTVLDALSKAIWSGLAGGHLTEDQAHQASVALEARRGEIRRPDPGKTIRSGFHAETEEKPALLPAFGADVAAIPSRSTTIPASGLALPVLAPKLTTIFARAKAQRPPDRAAAWARRRRLAASGPMPPQLACLFTTGELAVLRIIADEAGSKGVCDRTVGELAARAGVSETTVRNAVRVAVRAVLITKQERPRPGRKHLANVLRIISREWRAWIDRKGRAGVLRARRETRADVPHGTARPALHGEVLHGAKGEAMTALPPAQRGHHDGFPLRQESEAGGPSSRVDRVQKSRVHGYPSGNRLSS